MQIANAVIGVFRIWKQQKKILAQHQSKEERSSEIDLGRSNSRPGVHDAKSVRTRNDTTARKL
jgi:hypothetical protein